MRARKGCCLRGLGWKVVAVVTLGTTTGAQADLVKKVVVEDGKVVSGYVLQGSRNGVKFDRSRSVNRVIVPHFSLETVVTPVTVLPALESTDSEKEVVPPRPRFGYQSDYESEPQSMPHQRNDGRTREKPIPDARSGVAPLTPIFQFRTEYPRYEYLPGIPYYYGGSSCGHYHPYSAYGSYHFGGGGYSYSRFHGSISTPFFSFHWQR